MSFREKVSRRLKSWKTNPRFFRRKAHISLSGMVVMLFPFRYISPLVGLSRDASILSSVVFPEPDSPMMATYSPASTEKFTSERA